MQSFKECSFKM